MKKNETWLTDAEEAIGEKWYAHLIAAGAVYYALAVCLILILAFAGIKLDAQTTAAITAAIVVLLKRATSS